MSLLRTVCLVKFNQLNQLIKLMKQTVFSTIMLEPFLGEVTCEFALRPAPYSLQHTTFTLHPNTCTLQPTAYSLHPAPYYLHRTAYSLQPTACTLHPAP